MSSTGPSNTPATSSIHLPADLIAPADSVVCSKTRQSLEDSTKKFILLDPNKDRFHAGWIRGNPGGDDALAEKLFPAPGMQRRNVLLGVATFGGTVKITGIEFAQYTSELKIDDGEVSVVGMLRIKDRRQTSESGFVLVNQPSRKDSFYFFPGEMISGYPGFRKKGDRLEMQAVTHKDENEALEDFWERCRGSLETALRGSSPFGPGSLPK